MCFTEFSEVSLLPGPKQPWQALHQCSLVSKVSSRPGSQILVDLIHSLATQSYLLVINSPALVTAIGNGQPLALQNGEAHLFLSTSHAPGIVQRAHCRWHSNLGSGRGFHCIKEGRPLEASESAPGHRGSRLVLPGLEARSSGLHSPTLPSFLHTRRAQISAQTSLWPLQLKKNPASLDPFFLFFHRTWKRAPHPSQGCTVK